MARRWFGNDEPPTILDRLKKLYGTPILQKLDQSLLHLHELMDWNQPVEVMIRTTEEVQIFLMAHPDGYREIINVDLFRYAMIKLSKWGGLYTNAI